MYFIRYLHAHFKATVIVIFLSTGLSGLGIWGPLIYYQDSTQDIFLLGDSETGNFRFPPGEHIEDHLARLLPGNKVYNIARPGAFIADYYLLARKWERLIEPEVYVVLFSTTKFHFRAGLPAGKPRKPLMRLNTELANLRWTPLDAEGLAFWQTLSPSDQKSAIVQKCALITTGYYDLLEDLWQKNVLWPHQRNVMLAGGPDRAEKVHANAAFGGREWDKEYMLVADPAFENFVQVRDFEFLRDAIARRGKELLVVLLPTGNPDLEEQHFSPRAREHLALTRLQILRYLERTGTGYVDVGLPEDFAHYPPSAWDDLHHMKSGAAMAHIAGRIATKLSSGPAPGLIP